jgi:hypothetical protein
LDPERIEVDYNERSTMNITWGVVLTLLSLIGWAGQVITALSPRTGTKLGLAEPESMVDPAFAADVRAEAIWDIFVLWRSHRYDMGRRLRRPCLDNHPTRTTCT